MKEKSKVVTNNNGSNDNSEASAIKFRQNEFKSYMRLFVLVMLFLTVIIACLYLFYHSQTSKQVDKQNVMITDKSGALYPDITKIKSTNVSISNCVVVCADEYKDIGLILNDNEYVVTNLKLISKAKNIFVKLQDGRTLRGEMVSSDKQRGLAYLKMLTYLSSEEDGLNKWDAKQNFYYNQLVDLNKRIFVEKQLDRKNIMIGGQNVYCITANVENKNNTNLDNEKNYIRGIVLCNQYGNVLGVDFVNGLEMRPEDTYSFVDIDYVRETVNRVSDEAYMMMKKIGIEVNSAIEEGKFVGIYVKDVEKQSPMCNIGVFPTDIIIGLQDNKIGSMEQFASLLAMYKNNNKLDIKILRDDIVIKKTVVITEN